MPSVINKFPGYEFIFDENGKPHNMFRGEDVGFGGYVYAKEGMYGRTVVLDVSGQHPASIRAMNCFGDKTERFGELVDLRTYIKHGDLETARTMLDGKVAKYLDNPEMAKGLAGALKIAVNSVYGLTSASFDNPFRDIRNKNNIVALRGALFMVTLRDEVLKRGYTVISIKTDSIKIVGADDKIIEFCKEFGKSYGYNFEVENIFEKICLVNDSTFIAKCAEDDPDTPGQWYAKAAQFAVPYVFKTLFSREPIKFKDLCETKSVAKGELYLDMNESLPDVSAQEKELDKATQKYKKGMLSDISYDEIKARLEPEIETGHSYQFVGRVGSFCPIKPGYGGGILYRKQDGKYYAASGTKGYRWLESEIVRDLPNASEIIDESYYISLVDDAVETISQYGDFEMFVSEDPLAPYMNIPENSDEEMPFSA